MSLESHLVRLEERHKHLDNEIHRESTHAFPNEMIVASLKKKKLQIKQEIEKLKQE